MKFKVYSFIRSLVAKLTVLICWFNVVYVLYGYNTLSDYIYIFFYGIALAALADNEFHITELVMRFTRIMKRQKDLDK